MVGRIVLILFQAEAWGTAWGTIMKTYYERYLPHFTPSGGTFFITAVLKDALPVHLVRQMKTVQIDTLKQLKEAEKAQSISPDMYKQQVTNTHKKHFLMVDDLLDRSVKQEHYLKDSKVAQILADKIHQYDGSYYDLKAFSIMSNHFHLLIDTSIQLIHLGPDEIPNKNNYTALSKIMQYIKGGSAFLINKQLNRKGALWKRESYDHLVRDEKEQYRIHQYILNNPVKAGLVKNWWQHGFTFSSDPAFKEVG